MIFARSALPANKKLLQRHRRRLLYALALVELRDAERLTALGYSGRRSLRLDRALRLHDAVCEIGGGR